MPRTVNAPRAASAAEVLAKATVRAAQLLELNGAALGRVIGISEASVSRLVHGTRPLDPQAKEGQLAALLIRVYRSLDALVGNDAARRRAWMTSYNQAVQAVPREALFTPDGLVRVVTYLDGARAQA